MTIGKSLATKPTCNETIPKVVRIFNDTSSVHNLERSGQPLSFVTEQNIETVKKVLKNLSNTPIKQSARAMAMTKSS